jgi:hypothetical protein
MKAMAIFTFVLFLTVALDCSNSVTPRFTSSDGIYGVWNWVESAGGISGSQVLTPASQGYSVRIYFGSDSTFERFCKDTLQAKTRFTISRQKDPFTVDTMDVINYQDSYRFAPQVIYVLTADSLELRDERYDGMGHSYSRLH